MNHGFNEYLLRQFLEKLKFNVIVLIPDDHCEINKHKH